MITKLRKDIREMCKEDKAGTIITIFAVVVIGAMIIGGGALASYVITVQRYNKDDAYRAEVDARREKRHAELQKYYDEHTYEVVSVTEYTETETNMYGGVTGTAVKYNIKYIDKDGNLKIYDDFEPSEYGLEKLQIGDIDVFVEGPDREKFLILTKETLKAVSTKGEEQ